MSASIIDPEHIVCGVVLLRDDGAALLQLRDNKPDISDPGLWVFPGGHCNEGESLEECAWREFHEETNYRCERLRYLVDFLLGSDSGQAPRRLTFFWERFDGKQSVNCMEGQAIEFCSREKLPIAQAPDYLLQVWGMALVAAAEELSK